MGAPRSPGRRPSESGKLGQPSVIDFWLCNHVHLGRTGALLSCIHDQSYFLFEPNQGHVWTCVAQFSGLVARRLS